MTVKHVVQFSLKDEPTDEDFERIKAGLLQLPKEISVITSYEMGVDLKLEGGQTHPTGKNRHFCFSACFKDTTDYETYDKHPAHVGFVKDILGPVVLKGSRSAVQYQLDD